MSEQMIIEKCSPTLAGLKTASLFSCGYDRREELWNDIRRFNQTLSHKGIRMIPFKAENNRALIYVYRPKRLESDISGELSKRILSRHGYSGENVGRCIVKLICRLQSEDEFPHEIGLFLGYPPEDVKSFIERRGEGCKCVGYWKVYGDEKNAERCFENYKKCTRLYREQFACGKSIERLTVAV